jgi:hypothetical protein
MGIEETFHWWMWAVGCSEGNKLYFAKILIVFK